MFSRLTLLAALSLSSLAMVAGCATETGEGVGASASDVTAASQALVGAYKAEAGVFYSLILSGNKVGDANEFIAEVDTGIRCVTAPCPSSERVTGTFTVGGKTIELQSTTASAQVKHLITSYDYELRGPELLISKGDYWQTLSKVDSYCSVAADCDAQSIPTVRCVGAFACTPQNTCSFECGSANPCAGLDEEHCLVRPDTCKPKYGSSACTPDGICTADRAYKGCHAAPADVLFSRDMRPADGALHEVRLVKTAHGTYDASHHVAMYGWFQHAPVDETKELATGLACEFAATKIVCSRDSRPVDGDLKTLELSSIDGQHWGATLRTAYYDRIAGHAVDNTAEIASGLERQP